METRAIKGLIRKLLCETFRKKRCSWKLGKVEFRLKDVDPSQNRGNHKIYVISVKQLFSLKVK